MELMLIPEITGYPKDIRIICPNCKLRQLAEVHFFEGDPFETYFHECPRCSYFITESEWEEAR